MLLSLFLCCTALAQQYDRSSEQELVRLVNEERAKAGLGTLETDDRLTQVARQHSELMAEKNALSHQFGGEPNVLRRIASTTLRFNSSGENVAFDATARRAHVGLMNSPPHRANIMRSGFNVIGVGVVRKGDLIYVTQNFAHRLPEISIVEAEQIIAKAFASLRKSAGANTLPQRRNPELRKIACDMANDDRLNASALRGIDGVRNMVVYTATELDKLPSSAQKLREEQASGYSVGACFAKSASYPNAVYWVALVTYF
ncbi:MAG TPA: CAP domain-containing protein [Clostridia bacterium]|nr:CAP domain-containing protein [Clostridia bacterium]